MRRFTILLGVLTVVTILGLATCVGSSSTGGGAQAVTVTAVEYKFDPSTITVKVNQPVTVTLVNHGTVAHNWTVEGLDGNITTGNVDPGAQGSVTFTPAKTGAFKFLCTVPGHAQLGMVGQLVVQ